MKILIVEDDFASRKFMMDYMNKHGECDGTVDGKEAVEAFMMAIDDDEPYDLICLDIILCLQSVMIYIIQIDSHTDDPVKRFIEFGICNLF